MILLDATTKSLQVVLSGAVATNQLECVATWVDQNSTLSTLLFGSSDNATNSMTPVTLVAAPAASMQRQVTFLSIFNADTAAATVTVRYNDNSTIRRLISVTLAVGSTLTFEDRHGWMVVTADGVILAGASSALLTASVILTDAQIKTLPSGDFTIVQAPGANKRLITVDVDWFLFTAGGAYTNINANGWATHYLGGNAQTSYLPNDSGSGFTYLSNAFGSVQASHVAFPPFSISDGASGWGSIAVPENAGSETNAPLFLHFDNNGSGNLTGGNAANYLAITATYTVGGVS